MSATAMTATVWGHREVEDFLIAEAALLDSWELDAWFELFAEGATYEVPQAAAPEDASPETSLFYIADDYFRLGQRVRRLKNPEAHSEFPRSVCVRVVSNVRIVKTEGNRAHVEAVFVTYRSKNEITDIFPGHHRYILETRDDGLRIVSKRSTLALNNLRPQGRVSIILPP